jgi:hypothetical protein
MAAATSSSSALMCASAPATHTGCKCCACVDALLCGVCHEVLRDAVEASGSDAACGHIYCSTCVNLELSQRQGCPVCQAPLTREMLRPNVAIRRLTAALPRFRCPGCDTETTFTGADSLLHKERVSCPIAGCEETWPACSESSGHIHKHRHQCPSSLFPCAACSGWVKRSELGQHLNSCWNGRTMRQTFQVPYPGEANDEFTDWGINWAVQHDLDRDDGLTLAGLGLPCVQLLYGKSVLDTMKPQVSIKVDVRHPITTAVIHSVTIDDVLLDGPLSEDGPMTRNVNQRIMTFAELEALGAINSKRHIDWLWVDLHITVKKLV